MVRGFRDVGPARKHAGANRGARLRLSKQANGNTRAKQALRSWPTGGDEPQHDVGLERGPAATARSVSRAAWRALCGAREGGRASGSPAPVRRRPARGRSRAQLASRRSRSYRRLPPGRTSGVDQQREGRSCDLRAAAHDGPRERDGSARSARRAQAAAGVLPEYRECSRLIFFRQAPAMTAPALAPPARTLVLQAVGQVVRQPGEPTGS